MEILVSTLKDPMATANYLYGNIKSNPTGIIQLGKTL